jgi:hypothetical protein
MNENTRVHYQTSFRVKSTKPEYNCVSTLQNILYGWFLQKESDNLLRNKKREFYAKCDWSNLYRSHSSMATNTYYDDAGKCWAVRYKHLDGQLRHKRHWYVDIGVREIKEREEAIFYCKVSYARDEYDLSGVEFEQPSSNTPVFIRDILAKKSELKVYSQCEDFGLYGCPIPFRLTYGQDLVDLIESERRRYALLVVNGEGDAVAKQARQLAKELTGKAQVITLDQDPEFAEELRHCFKRDLLVKRGTVRVFFPLRKSQVWPERHRWFYLDSSEYEEQRKALVNSLLKNSNLSEDHAVKNISEIGRMISRKKLADAFKGGASSEAELDQFFDEYTKLEEEKAVIEKERDGWLEECDALEAKVSKLESDKLALSYHKEQQELPLQVCYQSYFGKLPGSLEELVRLKAKLLGERVIFAEEVFKSAAAYPQFKELDRAWEILYHIGTTLFEIKFEGDGSGDIAKRFQEKAGYEYAKTEGQNTKKDSGLRSSRVVSVDGREYEIWPHIVYGNQEPKMLRVHFAYDDDLRKIIVGYVGPHMDNASTRKKR